MEKPEFPYDQKWETVEFKKPEKKIIEFSDVSVFENTRIFSQFIAFLTKLQQSIISKSMNQTKSIDKFKIFDPLFQKYEEFLKDTPPINQPMRFGNRAFKDWVAKATTYTEQFLKSIIPQKISGCYEELKTYICQSYGSNVRIDYGSGHQMSFMFFCWALYRLRFCSDDELQNLVRQLFYRYVLFMRKVQVQYMLEPAGSHGVWGIDDYVFLPFLLGAAQMIGKNQFIAPTCIHNVSLVNQYADQYMYLNCIKFIIEQKKSAPFSQTSPVLDNISGAASWEKITTGMIKMYRAEVLLKHPVVKHQYFGTIIRYE